MQTENGILYVIAVPIGNYNDITDRARELLETVDYIAAEDTRRSALLLDRLGIKNNNYDRMFSNHKFNEYAKTRYFIDDMLSGKNVAIITDAGTPCISDPGNELIKEAIKNDIRVVPVPGCCAAVAALSVSGFDLRTFGFYGFFPREAADKKKILKDIRKTPNIHTCVFYESPKRIIDTVNFFIENNVKCDICLCNDMTKFHEYFYRGTPQQVLEELLDRGTYEKGEYVLLVSFDKEEKIAVSDQLHTPEALMVDTIMQNKCSVREAMKILLASETNTYSKNELYKAGINLKNLFSEE